MEFDETRWSCSWNSDQNCTQNCQGVVGVGVGGYRVTVGGGGPGWDGGEFLFDMKLTLSVKHNCLKLKMII